MQALWQRLTPQKKRGTADDDDAPDESDHELEAEPKKQKRSAEVDVDNDDISDGMKTPVIEGLTATQLVDKIHAFQALLDELKLEVTQVKLQAGLAQAEAEEASLQAGFAHSAAEEAANLVGELKTKVVEIESAFISTCRA